MTALPATTRQQDAILICGPWPHPRIAIFGVVHDLIADLNRRGRRVVYICEGYGVRNDLGPDAICVLDISTDRVFDWRSAFARKRVYPSLSAFLAEDRHDSESILKGVGILHAHLDKLVFASDHPENSSHFERTLSDYIANRTGWRPRLVRTRYDDMQGNLDGFMRLTGIDYVALDRAEREAILSGEVDLWPIVRAHTKNHREQMHAWGWDDTFIDEAIHHAWWRLHQLRRWRYELAHFDAVVCLTSLDVEDTHELLTREGRGSLVAIHNAASFQPTSQERIDHLLYEYHHREGLRRYRGAQNHFEPIAFNPADKKIVFVGRATRIKGCFELVESLRILYQSGRRNIRGILAGEFGSGLRQELAAMDPDHANEYLLFPGPVREVDVLAALFAFGDVTALPSHYEPFALVGLESYQMGTPCVVTEGTGAAEAYLENPRRHGIEMALPIRRRYKEGIGRYHGVDVESLAAQLAFLLDHPQVAGRMAEDGRRFVREHYSVERMAAQYAELYHLLLDGVEAARLTG